MKVFVLKKGAGMTVVTATSKEEAFAIMKADAPYLLNEHVSASDLEEFPIDKAQHISSFLN